MRSPDSGPNEGRTGLVTFMDDLEKMTFFFFFSIMSAWFHSVPPCVWSHDYGCTCSFTLLRSCGTQSQRVVFAWFFELLQSCPSCFTCCNVIIVFRYSIMMILYTDGPAARQPPPGCTFENGRVCFCARFCFLFRIPSYPCLVTY